MVMMPATTLCTAIHLFLFILIILLGSDHTTARAAEAAEVVGGNNTTVVADSQHSSLTSLSLANDYHHARPAGCSTTTVPGGSSRNNDALSSSSSSIDDNDERDEYDYNICINCHVVFDIRIVITDTTTTNNNNDNVDEELYSSTSNNERSKSTTSTPHSGDDNFTPRGSRLRIPMPSIQWCVMLHEILPAAINGGSNGATLLPLANAIAHPHFVTDASSSSSSEVQQDEPQPQQQQQHNHTLSARIVLPYSSFFEGGGKRAIKMMMMREAVVVVSLIREEEEEEEGSPNNNYKKHIVNRSLINVAIPNPHEIVNNNNKSRNIRQRSSSSSSSRTMASYYRNIDPIYATILEDSVPFINVDNDVVQTKNAHDCNSSSIEQDVTKVMVEKMENWSSIIIESTITTRSFDNKHQQYHTTVLKACFYGIIGAIMVLIFVMKVSSSFNNDDEVNDDDNSNSNNNYCHDDGIVGTPEPYTHNSDGEYIGPRDYSVVENDGMIVDLFHNAGNNIDDVEPLSLHNNDVPNDSPSPSSSSSSWDDVRAHRTAIEEAIKEEDPMLMMHLLYSPLDRQSPGSSIAVLPNSNSPSVLYEMTNYVEGDHEQQVADKFLLAQSPPTNSMLPQADKSYYDNHDLLGVFGTSKLDTESTENNDAGSIPEEDKVPSHDDNASLEDDVNENVSTNYVAESSNAPVEVDEVESRQQFQLPFDYHEIDRTTSAGVDSEIYVNIMSSETNLHINDDNEYEANGGKISLTSPPKIGRISTVDKNHDSVPFDPVTTCYFLPTIEVARCITRPCNERETIMEHGHELQQTCSRFESGVEDARDIDMSEDDIHYDVKQSSPRDSSKPSVSSSATTVRAHNSNCGVKRSATEFQNSDDGLTMSHLSTLITSVHTSDKRQRRQPTTIPARVSTSPTFAPALRESDVGNKENHSSPNYILESNEVLFGSNDNVSSTGCDSPSLTLEPLTKELSVDDTADRFPSPSTTVAATVHEFADHRRYNATTYDHPIPIPCGGAGQSKRFGISSTRTSSSISYPDQRFEQEPSDSLESNQVNDHARRKRTKQKTRKIESKLRAAMKRVISDKPSSALTDLSRRVEESAWQFFPNEIQINRRNYATDTTSEKSY